LVIDGLVEDVSRSGLFLRAPTQAKLGSTAVLDLALPDNERIRITAEVVRVDDDGMGLRFVDERGNRRPLANFMMRVHAFAS
jgi:hypothetical protein